jgi:hypothetical protein
MLLRRAVLDRIVAGEIDLVFRRWKRPTVTAGGSLRTSVGMLGIKCVERVAASSITAEQARRAGYATKAALVRELSRRTDGDLYRIGVRFVGADPRITLREDGTLSDGDFDELCARLDRLDRASKRGPWTKQILRLLAEHPHVRAQELADGLGLEKHAFKNDMRKLKALGLTISHSPGYEVSPRGRAFLERLDVLS